MAVQTVHLGTALLKETFFRQELDTSLDTVVIIAHQVVIRCCFVYLGYENKASVIDKQIDNCVPYEIEL